MFIIMDYLTYVELLLMMDFVRPMLDYVTHDGLS